MKILFLLLTLSEEDKGGGMYLNLAQEFCRQGHEVTLMAPDNNHRATYLREEYGMRVVRVGSKTTQGLASMIKKGIALATLPYYYKNAYKRFLANEKFDWVAMPTPPITLSRFVGYVKKQAGAKFYLILRDIHPQSIWSIGLLKYRWMYNYLDKKARYGYEQANVIGCMSQGNIDFIAKEYPNIEKQKLVLLYNWLEANESNIKRDNSEVRDRYGLQGKYVVLYGGNIGKGQHIENIVFLADHYQTNPEIVFVIIGKGVEKERLETIAKGKALKNVIFINYMPQEDYLQFVGSADLGLITINEKYAVPTCPSKAIAYMSIGIPIFAMINPNSDYGQWIEEAGAGYWTEGSDCDRATQLFDELYADGELRRQMSEAGRKYYEAHCTPQKAYTTMIEQMKKN